MHHRPSRRVAEQKKNENAIVREQERVAREERRMIERSILIAELEETVLTPFNDLITMAIPHWDPGMKLRGRKE